MNIRFWLKQANKILSNKKNSKHDIEILLSFIMKKPRSWLIAYDETELTNEESKQLKKILLRRAKGEPIPYILGEWEFWSLPLTITKKTLIPRPDTEILVEQALMHIPNINSKILDLGTGTGAIALAIASERPDCHIEGIDNIPSIITTAQKNATNLSISNAIFYLSNWFKSVKTNLFDLIISNPPYLDKHDIHLKQNELRFEPAYALIAKESGLSNLRILIEESKNWLKIGGWLLLEHGWEQDISVQKLMKKNGYKKISTIKDYSGKPRVSIGKVER